MCYTPFPPPSARTVILKASMSCTILVLVIMMAQIENVWKLRVRHSATQEAWILDSIWCLNHAEVSTLEVVQRTTVNVHASPDGAFYWLEILAASLLQPGRLRAVVNGKLAGDPGFSQSMTR